MNKKEITILTRDLTFGGGGIYTQGLINMFLNDGYKVNLVAPNNIFGKKVNFLKICLVGKYFITKELFFFFHVRNILLKNKLDKTIILSQHNFNSVGLRYIYQFRHSQHFGHIEALKKEKINLLFLIGLIFHSFYKILDYLSIRYARKVIFISQETFKKSKEIYKRYNSKFIYIPNFIEIENSFEENKSDISKILFIGRLERLKGIDLLCKIIEKNKLKLEQNIGKFKLIIVGEGYLENKINKYDFVDYKGRLERQEIIKLYRNCELFIFPSLYENCPTVILEAMLYGNLILSRNVGDTQYMLKNKEYQMFENNTEIVKKTIDLYRINLKKREFIISNNREKVKEYSSKNIYLKIKEIIYGN